MPWIASCTSISGLPASRLLLLRAVAVAATVEALALAFATLVAFATFVSTLASATRVVHVHLPRTDQIIQARVELLGCGTGATTGPGPRGYCGTAFEPMVDIFTLGVVIIQLLLRVELVDPPTCKAGCSYPITPV